MNSTEPKNPADPTATFPDRHTIRFDVTYPHPPSKVWQAITDPNQLAVWFMRMTIEPRVGGRVTLEHSSKSSDVAEGVVTALEPEALFEYRFEGGAPGVLQPGHEDNRGWPISTLRFELTAVDPDSCRMVFLQRLHPDMGVRPEWRDRQIGGPGTLLPGTCAGWQGFFDPGLTRFLDGHEPVYTEADDRLMDARAERYREMIENLIATDAGWAEGARAAQRLG